MNNTPEILGPSEWPSKFRAYKMNLLKPRKKKNFKNENGFIPSPFSTIETDSSLEKINSSCTKNFFHIARFSKQ